MEPVHWVIVFFIACSVVGLIAHKKGRSGLLFFMATALPAVPLMGIVSYMLGDNMGAKPFAMWSAAFFCPLAGFVVALMVDNGREVAVKIGDFGEYKKCPFCAESVRKEAIKCKHYGSDLTAK